MEHAVCVFVCMCVSGVCKHPHMALRSIPDSTDMCHGKKPACISSLVFFTHPHHVKSASVSCTKKLNKKDFVPLQLSLTQQINQRKVNFCVFLLLYFWPFMCSKVPYTQHQTHTDSKPVIHAYKFLHKYFYQYSSVKVTGDLFDNVS